MTAPPLAVVCCNAATKPTKLSNSTPASMATAPALCKALIKSSELTAKLTSTAESLSIMSVVVNPASPKAFTAAVSPATASDAFRLVSLVKIRASFVLFKTSSVDKPCLANSIAASEATLNPWAVFLAASNKPSPNCCICWFDKLSTTLISAKVFSKATASETKALNESLIPSSIATDAPNAITRALEASKDLVNSFADALILPRG